MTQNVYNQAEFNRAWAQAKEGDTILVVVQHRDDYNFQPAEAEPVHAKAEWSGCAC